MTMNDIHCTACNRKIGQYDIAAKGDGNVNILLKCKRCKVYTHTIVSFSDETRRIFVQSGENAL